MTPRKILKKKLAKLEYERAKLVQWVGCSEVYGDNYFTQDDIIKLDKEIQEVERVAKLQLGGEFIQVRDTTLINRSNYQDMLTLWGVIEDNGYKIFLNFTQRTTSRKLDIMELSTMQYLPEFSRDGNDLKYVHKVLIEFHEEILKEKISERKDTV